MLPWLTFWILQAFITCKDDFIESVFGMLPAGWNIQMFHIHLYNLCILLVRNGTLLSPFVTTS